MRTGAWSPTEEARLRELRGRGSTQLCAALALDRSEPSVHDVTRRLALPEAGEHVRISVSLLPTEYEALVRLCRIRSVSPDELLAEAVLRQCPRREAPPWHAEARRLRDEGYAWDAVAILVGRSNAACRVACDPRAADANRARNRRYRERKRSERDEQGRRSEAADSRALPDVALDDCRDRGDGARCA